MKSAEALRIAAALLICICLAPPLAAQTTDEQQELYRLLFTDYLGYTFRASSTLESSDYPYTGDYGMQVLFDGDQYTGWSEGTDGDGTGEALWLEIEAGCDTLLLKNGFGRSMDLFSKNNRVASLDVTLWIGYLPAAMVTEHGPLYVVADTGQQESLRIEDNREVQEHRFAFDYEAAQRRGLQLEDRFMGFAVEEDLPPSIEKMVFLLRMEITGVYRGNRWNDTCLTELRCFDSASFEPVEMDSLEGALRYREENGLWRFLYTEGGLLLDPYLLSPGGRWCVAFTAPRSAEGRVETGYALLRLPYPELYEHEGFEAAVYAGKQPIEFEEDGDAVDLIFDDGSTIRLE
ncbi:MAG: NADase-type glycan-binding domain-containing protein [Spirochaetales bacterium]